MAEVAGYGTRGATRRGGSERTLVATYDTRGAAETARAGLVSLGVSSGDVSVRDAGRTSHGGYELSARIDEGKAAEALDVIERSRPIDVGERGPDRDHGRDHAASGVAAGREIVRARALEVFGDPDVAERWLNDPNPALGARRPGEFARSAAGRAAVERVLSRIEHGDYS